MRGLWLYESPSHDPWFNLAIEEYLLGRAEDSVILYLWQNENTVVIGKNQNPWKECKTTLLEQEGGRLARRLSGGGAVFHDLGNLNFTFLLPQTEYDLDKQFSVIQRAVARLGIATERSGRNDVLAGGRKFSGNAFYKNGKQAYHHGTLLVDVDKDRLSRYLNPSKAKLQAKGVDSVRSRVVNLRELNPEVTIPALKAALAASFAEVYGGEPQILDERTLDMVKIEALAARNRSWQWNFGQKLPFSFSCAERFPWGGVEIELRVESGAVRQAKVYSDAMDWQLPQLLEQALAGCRFTKEDLLNAVTPFGEDLRTLIEKQDI